MIRGRGKGAERGRGSGRGRGVSRGGASSGSRGTSALVGLSKYLSFLLRHGAQEGQIHHHALRLLLVGLDLRSDGFARVEDILNLKKSKQNNYTVDLIRSVLFMTVASYVTLLDDC